MAGPFTGAATGRALTSLIHDTIIAAKHASYAADSDASIRATAAQLETWEREIAPRLASALSDITDIEDLPQAIQDVIKMSKAPENQTDFIIMIVSMIGLLLGGIQASGAGINSVIVQKSNKIYSYQTPDVASAIRGIVTGHTDKGDAINWVERQGLNKEWIEQLVKANSAYPTVGETLELLRRDKVDVSTADDWMHANGFQQSERAYLFNLQEQLPSAELAIQAYTQNQLSESDTRQFFKLNGIDDKNFQWIADTNGQSPGVDLVLELWNKRLISETEARTAVLESPIKNKYLEAMLKARFRIPPMEQTVSMLRRGAYTVAEATDNLSRLGYFPQDISRLVTWAVQEKISAEKDVAVGMVVDSYRVQLSTRPVANALLLKMKYDQTEADFILNLADAKRDQAKLDRSVNRVHSAFTNWKINDVDCSAALDALQVPSALRDDLIEEWQIERDVNTKHLTPAQIIDALKRDLLDVKGAYDRLLAIGYHDDDARILILLKVPDAFDVGVA